MPRHAQSHHLVDKDTVRSQGHRRHTNPLGGAVQSLEPLQRPSNRGLYESRVSHITVAAKADKLELGKAFRRSHFLTRVTPRLTVLWDMSSA